MTNVMDILRPEILSIGGRRYRKLPYTLKGSASKEEHVRTGPYTEDEDCTYYTEGGSCGMELEGIEQTSNGYRLVIPNVASVYFKFICGAGGKQKKDIESQTKTCIALPQRGEEGDIVVTGRDRSSVLSAKTRVEVIVESSRHKQAASHFLSIPLVSAQLENAYGDFKTAVIDTCGECRGVDESIFQLPCRLHLTLALLILQNQAEVDQAAGILAQAVSRLACKYDLQQQPLNILLSGIEYMNDEPEQVDVLYAKVNAEDESNRLQEFVNDLVLEFESSGLLKHDRSNPAERRSVKLHATVMNTTFRSARDQENSEVVRKWDRSGEKYDGGGGGRKLRVTFDARRVLKSFDEFEFGTISFDRIALSERGRYGSTGYYHQCACATI